MTSRTGRSRGSVSMGEVSHARVVEMVATDTSTAKMRSASCRWSTNTMYSCRTAAGPACIPSSTKPRFAESRGRRIQRTRTSRTLSHLNDSLEQATTDILLGFF
jgi:hypothetical protein